MDACPIGFEATPSWQRPNMVPIGGIINWSGAANDLPAGYQLCDGSNGTPDLRDQFIRGAGPVNDVGTTGGAEFHQHAQGSSTQVEPGSGPNVWVQGDSAVANNVPPFHALAYIQRMT